MEITFIRHGEAEHNVKYSQYGEDAYFDINLKIQNLQIMVLIKLIERSLDIDLEEFDIVITSSLERSLQTTDIIFGNKDILIMVSDLVRENNLNHPCNSRDDKKTICEKYPYFNVSLIDDFDDISSYKNTVDYRVENLNNLLKNLKKYK